MCCISIEEPDGKTGIYQGAGHREKSKWRMVTVTDFSNRQVQGRDDAGDSHRPKGF